MRPAAQSPIDARHAEMFPVLALSEIGRISRLGERRAYPAGARVFSTGEIAPGAFVLLSGQVDIMQRVGDRDAELIVSHGPGSFMGELAQLSGHCHGNERRPGGYPIVGGWLCCPTAAIVSRRR
jgi:thioredoxin reductase (NADPH)